MNNKQQIIDKIISDANAVAENNISKANAEASSILNKANDTIKELKAKAEPVINNSVKSIISSGELVANLDTNRMILSAKTNIVDNIFGSVSSTLRKNDLKKYLKIVESMIIASADDGDQIQICSQDKDVITSDFVKKISTKIKKGLSLYDTFGDFSGGIILIGKSYDKNLTFEVEYEEIKTKSESELVKILFGE